MRTADHTYSCTCTSSSDCWVKLQYDFLHLLHSLLFPFYSELNLKVLSSIFPSICIILFYVFFRLRDGGLFKVEIILSVLTLASNRECRWNYVSYWDVGSSVLVQSISNEYMQCCPKRRSRQIFI